MSVRTLLCSFGAEAKLSFYLEASNAAFDYEKNTRDVSFNVIAVSEYDGNVRITSSSVNILTVCGKNYMLPTVIDMLKGEAVIFSATARGLSGSTYVSRGKATLVLAYQAEPFGDMSGAYSVTVSLPKMYTVPELSLQSERIALGNTARLVGDMLTEGYALTAHICYANGDVLMIANVDGYRSELMTDIAWIEPYTNSREFDGYIRILAAFNGVPLPETLDLSCKFYLPLGVGAPTVSISESFVSENGLIASLDVGVRNRSALNVVLSDATAYYGATVTGTTITYKGVTYNSSVLGTDILTDVGTFSYTVRVEDSRGSAYTEVREFTVSDYAAPTFTADVKRVDSDGTENKGGSCILLSASVDETYSFGGVNAYRLYYTYAKPGEAPINDRTEFAKGGQYLIDLSLEMTSVYEITVYCEDSFGSITECKYLLDCERVELNIAKNKVSVGKYAEKENVFDCAWDIHSDGDIIFTDGKGNERRARETVSFGISDVTLEQQLQDLLHPTVNGVRIELMNVAPGMTVTAGFHVFLTYKNDNGTGYCELNTV